MEQPEMNFPAEFIDRMSDLYGVDRAQAICGVLEHRRPTTFRVNTLKATVGEVKAQLEEAGFELEKVPWTDAFILRQLGIRQLEEKPAYQQGQLYVQGLSSMIPPVVLDAKPGESILDIAAAPGSKTTQIAAMMKNEGMILANDTSRVRLYKLQANLERQGVSIVQTKHGLGQGIWRDFPEVFDRALVDVPCSMEGRFLRSRPKSYANWSPKKIKELAQRQKKLLWSAVSATRPGGEIVYSTCTLAPEENEGVVDWIMNKVSGALELQKISVSGVPLSSGVSSWRHTHYTHDMSNTARIIPTAEYEGFFIASFKKLESTQ